MSKLQNIKAIQQMIEGTHKFQTKKTFSFRSHNDEVQKEKRKEREVGEIWEEKDYEGKTVCWWEQYQGYRRRHGVHPDVSKIFDEIRQRKVTFVNCPKEECTCKKPSRLDERFKKMMGLCHDCVVAMETNLKIHGKFDQYALQKMQENAKAFFREKDAELEQIKKELTNPISYVAGADGIEEKWEVENSTGLIQTIEENYNKYKQSVLESFISKDSEES